jgi:ankyrin repeat protein
MIVGNLIAAGASPNEVCSSGRTALSYAAQYNSVDVARELIQAEADLDLPDEDGTHPFSYAVCYSSYEVLRMLIEAGAKKPPFEAEWEEDMDDFSHLPPDIRELLKP